MKLESARHAGTTARVAICHPDGQPIGHFPLDPDRNHVALIPAT